MKKYTFFLEWGGGTYISQCSSNSLIKAINIWSISINMTTIGANENSKSKFLVDIQNELPVVIEDVTSVWCISSLIEDELAIIHIVETVK